MKLVSQSIVILLSVFILFVIVYNNLISYSLYILAFFLFTIIIYAFFKKSKKHNEIFSANNFEIFIIMTSVLLIVFLTGGIKSPIFFLTYFLLFGITFIFEPLTIFIFLVGMVVLFGPEAIQGDISGNILKLGSLIILAPIAYFFGREHKKRERLSNQIKINSEEIIKHAESLLDTKDKNERLKKTEEIIESASNLKKEASKK